MKKIIFFLFFIGKATFAQETVQNNNDRFNLKQDQLTLDIELLSIGFTGAHAINKRMGIGFGFQFGLGIKYILNNPDFLYYTNECVDVECISNKKLKSVFNKHYELLKIKLFWRYHVTPASYLNAGLFVSRGGLLANEELPNILLFTGLQIDFFTGLKKFKIGIKTQAGKSFMSYSSNLGSQFFLLSISPAIQIYF